MKPEEQLEEVQIEENPEEEKLQKLKELINRMKHLEENTEKMCQRKKKSG